MIGQISLKLGNKEYIQLTKKQAQLLFGELINGEKTPDLKLSSSVFIYRVSDNLFLLVDNFNYQYMLIRDDQEEILSYSERLLKDLISEVTLLLYPYRKDINLNNIQYYDNYYFFVYPDADTFREIAGHSSTTSDTEVFSLAYEGEHFTIVTEEYRKGRRYHKFAYRVFVYSPSIIIHLIKKYLNDNYMQKE